VEGLREAAGKDHIGVAIRCSPFHTASAFHPIIEHLKRVFGWQPEAAPQHLAKLEAGARRLQDLASRRERAVVRRPDGRLTKRLRHINPGAPLWRGAEDDLDADALLLSADGDAWSTGSRQMAIRPTVIIATARISALWRGNLALVRDLEIHRGDNSDRSDRSGIM
jgi:hypothetical protein